eukprot:31237-Pelagococcus_subviridis.AAC.6
MYAAASFGSIATHSFRSLSASSPCAPSSASPRSITHAARRRRTSARRWFGYGSTARVFASPAPAAPGANADAAPHTRLSSDTSSAAVNALCATSCCPSSASAAPRSTSSFSFVSLDPKLTSFPGDDAFAFFVFLARRSISSIAASISPPRHSASARRYARSALSSSIVLHTSIARAIRPHKMAASATDALAPSSRGLFANNVSASRSVSAASFSDGQACTGGSSARAPFLALAAAAAVSAASAPAALVASALPFAAATERGSNASAASKRIDATFGSRNHRYAFPARTSALTCVFSRSIAWSASSAATRKRSSFSAHAARFAWYPARRGSNRIASV